MSEWVNVQDRLPDNEKDVLVCVERRHHLHPERTVRFVVKAFYTDGEHDTKHSGYQWDALAFECDAEGDTFTVPAGWWESAFYAEEFSAITDRITHWMPLPTPPKEVTPDG